MDLKWIIAGLGNPGSKYSKTRHNIGFRVIDQLSKTHDIQLQEKELYIMGKGLIEGCKVILLKPLTFMNRSGLALNKILKKNNASPENLIVIHDDLDIDTGIIRIRRNGTSGGHRGIESIIHEISTKDFLRVKIGIGRDMDIPVDEYVLTDFKPSEKDIIKDAIINAVGAVVAIIAEGVDRAMNKYNRTIKT